jgi:hypothetical protein
MNLKTIEDGKKLPADALTGMLVENDAIAPMSYSWDAKRRRFYLNAALDARDFGPASLRKLVDSMTASCRRTADFWDPSRWKAD